ncbi:MAG TPA: membrane protein insertase YidC [Candidatus Acidoferrales bacterium]|nr:membrane protein insertase YidC [Candidatus Acidoferrales bacterium]
MGKTETIGIVLITLVLLVWMYFNTPKQPARTAQQTDQTQLSQGNNKESASPPRSSYEKRSEETGATVKSNLPSDTAAQRVYGKTFAPLTKGVTKTITIKTSLYTAVLTAEGGMLKSWSLTKFNTWRGKQVQLVNYLYNGDYSLLFQTMDGKLIDTKDLYFDSPHRDGEVVTLSDSQRCRISFSANVGDSAQIVREFSFKGGVYDFGSDFVFRNMDRYIANYEYQVTWEHGLNYTEANSVDESSFSTSYAYIGGDVSTLEASKLNETARQELSGNTGWVSQTTKYFTAAIVPMGKSADGAYLQGTAAKAPDNGLVRSYYTALQMRFEGQPYQADSFMVYVGPLDYRLLKSYNVGLEETVGLGWRWIIRPIGEYVMLPAFQFIHLFIPNYGVAIIIFSILLKLLLNPLTASSMKSMRKMQALQPMMNEIKEKYKEDPQKMNQAVMNLYKEYKINPMGGCLPMILQMPILYALWAIFRSNIALRQSHFVWWIKDLSVPDTIMHLPFTIPFVGLSQVSGLALLMAITMFVQQKMSMKDPRQQFMVWFMPVMFWLLFNNFPSGLNLYYFVFNLLSIGQQYLMNKKPQEELLLKPAVAKRTRPVRPPMGNRFMRRNM